MGTGKSAFGAPGDTPHWAHADKDGVGTAFGGASRIWFTTWRGTLTEVYYPTVDRPQLRNLEFFITGTDRDRRGFLHEESKDLDCDVARIPRAQGYSVRRSAPGGIYLLEKEIIADPDQSSILVHSRFSGGTSGLRCYVVCNPHLDGRGESNSAFTQFSGDRRLLVANCGERWMVLGAEPSFERLSCGYVGRSDGATDLRANGRMDWEFEKAEHGNVALTGEIDLSRNPVFTLALALGDTHHAALTSCLNSLAVPYADKRKRFVQGWEDDSSIRHHAPGATDDGVGLFDTSCNVLTIHKDKTYLGAIVAALAIPFGEVRTDQGGKGGYHLVWPRDVVNSATALLAAGERRTALETLAYLAVAQHEDGSFAQNFWINGHPCWSSLQLDEVTYPVLLAYRLKQHHALDNFSPLRMVLKAAEYIVHQGPITPQERWEQVSGYSPSTTAVVIAALLCAGSFAREAGKPAAADFLTTYADYLVDRLSEWMVTTKGDLHPDIHRYFVRINPAKPGDGTGKSPNETVLTIPDQPPGSRTDFPAKDVVDAGFLLLVRYGILAAHDPLVVDSLRVVDKVLKVDTPFGPCWRRFNHDGYGQRDDGAPYDGWGKGRAWPLLTGERGHYELAAGRDPKPYLRAMERFATPTGLLAEQVWDEPKVLDGRQLFGRPTGSAVPLAWAHAEYIKLALSAHKGSPIDTIPEVADRYLGGKRTKAPQMWTFAYPVRSMHAGETLRIYARRPFRLRYSLDNWASAAEHRDAEATGIEIHFVDIEVPPGQKAPVRFTFLWPAPDPCDRSIEVLPPG